MPDTGVSDWTNPATRHDDVREIRQLTRDWLRAESERDLSRLLSLAASDVVVLRPRADAIEGRQALEDFYRVLWSQFEVTHSISTQEVRVTGEWAFTWAREQITLTRRNDAQRAFHLSGTTMTILRRGHDGRWRVSRAITNALPGSTPEPAWFGAQAVRPTARYD